MVIKKDSARPIVVAQFIGQVRNSHPGQTLAYFVPMLFVLVLMWAMVINFGKLLKDRMMMQQSADNAALAVAQYQARVLNTVGYLNNSIAGSLSGLDIGYPILAHINMYDQTQIGHRGDGKCDGKKPLLSYRSHKENSKVKGLRDSVINPALKAQKALVDSYSVNAQIIANKIANIQEKNNAGENTGADIAAVVPFTIKGLKKSDLSIKYYTTVVHEFNWFMITVFSIKKSHAHFFLPELYKEDKGSWYYIDEADFSKRKITVTCIKNSASDSNKGYPLMGKFFGIEWPVITTMASAAVYNTKGPMFPKSKGDCTGMNIQQAIVAIPNTQASLANMYQLLGEMAQIGSGTPLQAIGAALAGTIGVVVAAINAVAIIKVVQAINDSETPIKAYETAAKEELNDPLEFSSLEQKYGWEAHLVPAGGPMIH